MGAVAGPAPAGSVSLQMVGDNGPVFVRHRVPGRFDVGLYAQCQSSPHLMLPYFEITRGDPEGPNTLFAFRNNYRGDEHGGYKSWVWKTYDEYGRGSGGYGYRAPFRHVQSVNLGDELANSDLTRGFVLIYTSNWSNSGILDDGTGALSGDFFLVDRRRGLASGGALIRHPADACTNWTTRFLNRGALQGNTRILVHGYNAGFTAQVYDPSGRLIRSYTHRKPGRWIDAVDIRAILGGSATPASGSLRIYLQGRGYVFVEHRAAGKYAIGVKGNCVDP
jgi:hypothetical protein